MKFKTIELPIIMNEEFKLLSEIDPIALPYWNAYWALPDELLREHSYVWRWWGARTYSGAELVVAENQKLALIRVHYLINMPDTLEPAAYALFFEGDIILFHVSVMGTLEYKDLNNIRESDEIVGVIVQPFILPAHLQSRRQEIEMLLFEFFKYSSNQLKKKTTVEFSLRFGCSHNMRDRSYIHEISMPINNRC
ncbi:MAG: hypothetical protein WA154_09805 [Moraxellaceae bacterium]